MAAAVPALPDAAPELGHRSVLTSAAAIGIFTGLARIAGAGKTALITLFFRPGAGLDTYLLAFLIPSFLADVFCGALHPVLVPVLVEARATKGRAGAEAIYADALYSSVSAAALLAALVAACVFLADSVGWYTRTANAGLFHRMLLVMIPILPLSAAASVWRSVLNADMRFGAASFSFLLTPVIASVFLGVAHSWGVTVLAAGSAAGLAGEALFLAAALRYARIPVLPARFERGSGVAAVRGQYGAMVALHLVMKGAFVIDQAAAAMLGAGALSVFSLSTRIGAVAVAVGPEALGTALLPRFSQLNANRDIRRARQSLLRSLSGAVIPMTLVAGLLIWFSAPLVKLVFGHGALTPGDLALVTQAQRWALTQVPFSVGLAIVTRFVASLKANHAMLPVWVAALVAHAALDYLAMQRFGVTGIICVSALIEALVLLAILYLVFRRLAAPDLNSRPAL